MYCSTIFPSSCNASFVTAWLAAGVAVLVVVGVSWPTQFGKAVVVARQNDMRKMRIIIVPFLTKEAGGERGTSGPRTDRARRANGESKRVLPAVENGRQRAHETSSLSEQRYHDRCWIVVNDTVLVYDDNYERPRVESEPDPTAFPPTRA